MDFRVSPEEETLRQRVREFVQREWNPDRDDASSNTVYSYDIGIDEAEQRIWDFARKLAKTGWFTMHWPKRYGGGEAPLGTQIAYREEMAYRKAPVALAGGHFAWTLIHHGQDWQRDYFLPRIATAENFGLSQGMSEPGAGSDLANIQSRGVRDGDDWLITGQKMWNSGAHHPWTEWGYYLVRTDPDLPKHRGLTLFLIDLRQPGVAIRPVYDGLGRRRWSEVFLDRVRVPAQNVIGEVNRGWYAAMTNFSFERVSVDIPARLSRAVDDLLDFARTARAGAAPSLSDPAARHLLADLKVQIETCRLVYYRVAWLQTRGEVPVKEASISKLWGDQLTSRVYQALASLLGETGVLLPGNERAPLRGYLAANAWLSGMNTIGGGTAEVQRNIVAQRGLGLPR
ncbi:MAG: acyl-CoA dehydrogenase family protein [Chloroflexi bacterium]|nr:acyl-CoA dehydrogenase family protein [Chloroflexota bacterium]